MNENVYKELIENLPIAALFLVEGRIVLNKKARQLTGYSESDFKSVDDWFELTFKDQAKVAKEAYLEAKLKNFPEPFRVEFIKKNGDKIITDLTGNLNNNLETWLIEDVADRLLAEERYSVLFNHSTDAHLLLNDNEILDCNWTAVKILNAESKEQLLNFHPASFSPEFQPDGRRSLEKGDVMIEKAWKNGYHRFEWLHRKITGEDFYVEVTLNPVEVAGKKMILVIWHDLTEIKEAQSKLEEERSRNFHASKMATLGEMASGIAHEINNPLTVILNRVIQIRSHLKQDPPAINAANENVEKTILIINRITKIINGLRKFARDGSQDSYAFYPVKRIVEESLDLCQSRFYNFNVALRVVFHPGEESAKTEIFCVPVQIQQVLVNLLNNAFDAVVDKSPNWVELAIHVEDKHITMKVTDSGDGIGEHLKTKIMQPFFTTKEIGKGTGLGLSISKGIIEAHKGEFFLDDKAKNTRFVVKLPLIARADHE